MMARNSGTNIANGILSAIVLACGIVFSVLVAVLFKKYLGIYGLDYSTYSYSYASAPIWSVGFGYIIPGLIGVIASGVGQKGGYITQMVFCIITLLIMGIFFVVGIIALTAMSLFTTNGCYSVGSSCTCLNGLSSSSMNIGYTCEDINSLGSMSVGICAMMVIGWIFALIACITGGILACQQETQPGVIIHPVQHQPALTVMHMGPMGVVQPQQRYVVQPQQGYVTQPGYGMQPGYGVQPGYSQQYPAQSYTNQAYNPGDNKEQT